MVTATRICAHDETHLETETVNVTSEVTRAATCGAKGETKFTSSAFENTAFEIQTKTIQDIPALKDLDVMKLPSEVKRIESESFRNHACEAVIIPDGCARFQRAKDQNPPGCA